MSTQDELITRAELAAELRIGEATAESWARKGIGPQPIRLGPRLLRYRRRDVDAWLAANSQPPSAFLDAGEVIPSGSAMSTADLPGAADVPGRAP